MNIARIACYALMGGILSAGGITYRTWHLYAILALVGVIATLSELITVGKCP